MKKSKLSRRSLLSLSTRFAGLAPFLNLMEEGLAQGSAPRLRFLGIFTPHCASSNLWLPRGSRTNFDISFANSVLAPLAPFKSKLMVIDGLGYRILYDQSTPHSGHEGGLVTAFTGSEAVVKNGSLYAKSESIDQYLAAQLGASTKFSSFNFGGVINGGTQYDTYVFGPGGSRITNSNQPQQSFDTLFAGLSPTPSKGPDLRLQAKQSVLDFQRADLERLRARIGAEDSAKVDQFATALREIERRLASLPTVGCTIPLRPAKTYDTTGFSKDSRDLIRLHSQILAQAFACDLTRFATFGISPGQSAPWLPGLESFTDVHEQIAHTYDPANPASVERLAKLQLWYSEQVAYLLSLLDSIQDVDGRTVLDNTIVYWTTDVGETAGHGNTQMPVVLAGGAGEVAKIMKMGQFVSLQANRSDSPANAIPHNQLLTTIARVFGLPLNSFGDPRYTGALNLL